MDTKQLRPNEDNQIQAQVIETTLVTDLNPANHELQVCPATPHKSRAGVVLRIMLLGVLIAGGTEIISGGRLALVFGQSRAVEEMKQELAALQDKAAKEEKLVWDKFARQLQQMKAQNHAECMAAVNPALDELVTVKQVGLLVADFAKDQVLGGNNASDRVAWHTAGLTERMKHASVRAASQLDQLVAELDAVNNRHAIKAGAVIDQHKADLTSHQLSQLAAINHGVAGKIAWQTGSAGGALAFEAMTTGATKQAVINLLVYLSRKLGPQIAKAVTGVTAAAIDGPLPFGDILTVGLALWTVWDVVSLPSDIRADVRNHFEAAVNQHLTALNEQMEKSVQEIAKRQRSVREQVSAQVLASL